MEGDAQKCFERFCELAHKTVDQLHKVSAPCLDDHKKQNVWKLWADFFSDGIEMPVFGKTWKNRSTLDSEILGKISYKVEPSMRSSISTSHQRLSSHDQLRTVLSSSNQLQTVLSRWKSSNRLQTGIIPRRRFRRTFRRLKINFRWCSV